MKRPRGGVSAGGGGLADGGCGGAAAAGAAPPTGRPAQPPPEHTPAPEASAPPAGSDPIPALLPEFDATGEGAYVAAANTSDAVAAVAAARAALAAAAAALGGGSCVGTSAYDSGLGWHDSALTASGAPTSPGGSSGRRGMTREPPEHQSLTSLPQQQQDSCHVSQLLPHLAAEPNLLGGPPAVQPNPPRVPDANFTLAAVAATAAPPPYGWSTGVGLPGAATQDSQGRDVSRPRRP